MVFLPFCSPLSSRTVILIIAGWEKFEDLPTTKSNDLPKMRQFCQNMGFEGKNSEVIEL